MYNFSICQLFAANCASFLRLFTFTFYTDLVENNGLEWSWNHTQRALLCDFAVDHNSRGLICSHLHTAVVTVSTTLLWPDSVTVWLLVWLLDCLTAWLNTHKQHPLFVALDHLVPSRTPSHSLCRCGQLLPLPPHCNKWSVPVQTHALKGILANTFFHITHSTTNRKRITICLPCVHYENSTIEMSTSARSGWQRNLVFSSIAARASGSLTCLSSTPAQCSNSHRHSFTNCCAISWWLLRFSPSLLQWMVVWTLLRKLRFTIPSTFSLVLYCRRNGESYFCISLRQALRELRLTECTHGSRWDWRGGWKEVLCCENIQEFWFCGLHHRLVLFDI